MLPMAAILFTFLVLVVDLVLAIPAGKAEQRQIEIGLSDFKPRPKSDPGCVSWIKASKGDSCFTLYNRAGILNSFEEFLSWNPELKADCNAIAPGYSYCKSAVPPPSQFLRRSPQSPSTADFPAVPPQLKCITKSSAPTTLTSGLFILVSFGCGWILLTPTGSSKFLEKGPVYSVKVGTETPGKAVRIELQIQKGGFTLGRQECETLLGYVIYGCDIDGQNRNRGGCMYSADYNLEACIFPYNK